MHRPQLTNKRPILSFMAIVLSILWGSPHASMNPFTARYDIEAGGLLIGHATKTLEKANDHTFHYNITPKVTGIAKLLMSDQIHMYAEFDIKANHVLPIKYVYSQSGGRKTKHVKLIFKKDQVCNLVNHQCWPNRSHTTFDPISIDVAYPLALQNHTADHQYTVITGEKEITEKTIFHIEGHETITVPAGRFETLKVRMDEPGKNRPTELWLGKDTQYTPIRIIQYRRKHKLRLELNYYAEPAAHQARFDAKHPHKNPLRHWLFHRHPMA